MKIHQIQSPASSPILDGDIQSPDEHIFVTELGKVYRNHREIKVKQSFSFGFPFIRVVNKDLFLLIDGENNDEKHKNAWLINSAGETLKNFYIGPALKVLISNNLIIISYSDASLNTGVKFATQGLAVFDLAGNCLFEYYKDTPKTEWVPGFIQNYGFLRKDNQSIYFLAYHSLDMVELNLNHFSTQIVFSLDKQSYPKSFYLPHAFSKKGDSWYFITPQTDSPSLLSSYIFEMDSSKNVVKVGECIFSPRIRGLENGKFSVPYAGVCKREAFNTSNFIEF